MYLLPTISTIQLLQLRTYATSQPISSFSATFYQQATNSTHFFSATRLSTKPFHFNPATSFSPDLSSPGPGKTEGIDKSANPEIKSSDIKPNYVIGGPNTGTKNPAAYAQRIAAQLLGVPNKLGSSE